MMRLQNKKSPRAFASASEERRANLFAWCPSAAEANPRAARGFTLLLAVLVSSILVGLGSAIYDIVSKELTLSSSGRESQFAFYSADTGIECALYWDLRQNAFATTSPLTAVACGGGPDVSVARVYSNLGQPSEIATTTFSFPIDSTSVSAPCATVSVTKTDNPTKTVIISSGYNTCNTGNALRLERAIRVNY